MLFLFTLGKYKNAFFGGRVCGKDVGGGNVFEGGRLLIFWASRVVLIRGGRLFEDEHLLK